MTLRKTINKQIRSLTQHLIETSFAIRYNYPKWNNHSLVWERYSNAAFVNKDEPYQDMYNSVISTSDFNILLLDYGILQFKYSFKRDQLLSHVLHYLPNPNLKISFSEDGEEFEELYYDGTTFFADMYKGTSLPIPVRFDYSQDHTDLDHAKCHATIGGYRRCRIPISQPVSPNKFVQFILRNFYFDRYKTHLNDKVFHCETKLDLTISNLERSVVHFNL